MDSSRFGGQIYESTRLSGDYVNMLAEVLSSAMDNKDGHPVPMGRFTLTDYEAYCLTRGNMGQEAIDFADPEALATVLELAREFNGLPLEKRMDEHVVATFSPRLRAILSGEQTPE